MQIYNISSRIELSVVLVLISMYTIVDDLKKKFNDF